MTCSLIYPASMGMCIETPWLWTWSHSSPSLQLTILFFENKLIKTNIISSTYDIYYNFTLIFLEYSKSVYPYAHMHIHISRYMCSFILKMTQALS